MSLFCIFYVESLLYKNVKYSLMKRFLWLIFIGFALTSAVDINAQEGEKEDYFLLGKHADEDMYRYYNEKEYHSAIKACNLKADYFYKAESWVLYVTALNDRAFLYNTIDDLSAYKEVVFSNFEEAEKYLKNDHPEWLRAKEQINTYYYIIGDYKNSLEIVKEVVPLKEKLNFSKLEISNSYLNLGTAYNRLQDSENALRSFKISAKTLNDDEESGLIRGERFNNIARVYQSKGELDSALFYLEMSENLYEKIETKSRFKRRKVETFILLVEVWLEKKDFDKARHYLDLTKKQTLSNRENVVWYARFAKYNREIGNYEKSKESILKATEIAKEFNTRYSPPTRVRRKIELVKSLILSNEKENALQTLQEGLLILSPTFKEMDIHANPSSENLLDKPDALTLFQEKARILFEKYENLDSLKYLKSSFNSYLSACDVIKDIRQGIRSSVSKNELAEKTISVYEEAIGAANRLFKLTGDTKYLTQAFKLAESNKAQLLLENFNEQEARGLAAIPDSLSEKEKDLKFYLAALEDIAIREGRNSNDDDNIFKLRQEINQFSSFLEKSYPRYYEQKYNNETVDPTFVRKNLINDNTALIEYFVGIDKIYVFVLTKNLVFLDELSKDSLNMDQISEFRTILKNRPGNRSSEKEYSEFVSLSCALYNSFVKVALERLPASIKSLIIVPDDQINYIPFEVLLMDEPYNESSYSLDAQAYLFENYAVNYNYSATLLNKVVSKDPIDFKSNFIGYAPTFDEKTVKETHTSINFELSNLKCSKDEVSSIESIVGGEKRISEAATKDNFLNEVKDFKIIHLATHTFVNPNDSKLNRIFLQDDFLSDVNLYNLELNTELAVLSACNTGSGELLKGEGVMNLARGFINAGCSSTLMSMWSVDDCTTADLMLLFYKEIKKGLRKDEALKRAKIEYLRTANKTKLHPYYWAAFIPFGDMKALDVNNGWFLDSVLPIGLIISVLLLLVFYFRKNK